MTPPGGNSDPSANQRVGPVEFVAVPAAPGGAMSWLPAAAQNHGVSSQVSQLLLAGDSFSDQGQYLAALEKYGKASKLEPANPDAHYKLACAAWKAACLTLVERHYRLAVQLNPRHAKSHDGLARWYLYRENEPLALQHSAAALELEPRNADYIVSHASALAAGGKNPQAWDMLETVKGDPWVAHRVAGLYVEIAPRISRQEQAAGWVNEVLRTGAVDRRHRQALHFAAAAIFDRVGRFDEAFEQIRLAHQLSPHPYDPARQKAWVDRRIEFCTPQRLRSLPQATHGSRRPVFIVGMPRSGTSLVEQILASHSQVFGAGELDDFTRRADALDAQGYPACLERLSLDRVNQLAAEYLAALQGRNAGAAYVTDKMPRNFAFLEIVGLLFPNCHAIHCVRDPMDTCLSCYITRFAGGNEFAHDLAHLGHYYRQYQRLMDHWKHVLSLPILEVKYEDVVGDLEGQARRMLEFLQLPFDPSCLSFHQTRRSVITASRDQVRRPLYASSIGRWKRYERHLGGLLAALK